MALAPAPPDRIFPARARLAGLYALLAAANLAAWAWAWSSFGARPALLGSALLAWIFGLRHAMDADHIAAIDNVVRKLMQEGRRPTLAGQFFSLGHSAIVVLACAVLAVAAAGLGQTDGLRDLGALAGTAVSSLFLLGIGLGNLFVLRGTWRSFRQVRRGVPLPAGEAAFPDAPGILTRLFRPLFRVVTREWHMYLVGFLFGLGFDTATEIGLLAISATQAMQGLSAWQVMIFPALFTAGMALVDTADSALMVGVYGWAFVSPARKLWYNLTITAASVAVALLIGGVEALGLLGSRMGLTGGFWRLVGRLNDDMADFGFAVTGIFLLCWALSAALYRWTRPVPAAADGA